MLSDEAEEYARLKFARWQWSHITFSKRGAAEAGDVKFAVEQRMGSAVMLLQEVRNWPGDQGVLSGNELYTDIEFDTAVAIPRDFACDVREKVLSKKYTFVVLFGTIWGFGPSSLSR